MCSVLFGKFLDRQLYTWYGLFLFEKRCGIRQSYFFVSYGFGWLRKGEREKLSQWLWKKSHLDWPERLDILRYDFVFVFLLLKCVATSIRFCYLPSKISLISIFRDSALYDIILNLISVEIYRFKKINIEKHREQSNGIHLRLDRNLYKPIHLLWFQLRFLSKTMMNIILSCSFRIQFRFEFEIYFKDSLFYSHKRLHLRISIGVQFARCIRLLDNNKKSLNNEEKLLFHRLAFCLRWVSSRRRNMFLFFLQLSKDSKRWLYATNSAITKKMLQTIYITITLPSFNPYKMNRTLYALNTVCVCVQCHLYASAFIVYFYSS